MSDTISDPLAGWSMEDKQALAAKSPAVANALNKYGHLSPESPNAAALGRTNKRLDEMTNGRPGMRVDPASSQHSAKNAPAGGGANLPKMPKASDGGALRLLNREEKKAAEYDKQAAKIIIDAAADTKDAIQGLADVDREIARANHEYKLAELESEHRLMAEAGDHRTAVQNLYDEQKRDLERAREFSRSRANKAEFSHHFNRKDDQALTESERQKSRDWLKEHEEVKVGGGKIGALVALSLLGRTKLGGIADAIQSIISMDIHNQEEAFRRNKNAYTDSAKYWNDIYEVTQDKFIANKELESQGLRVAQKELEKQLSGINVDKGIQANADKMLADIDERMAKNEAAVKQRMADRAVQMAPQKAQSLRQTADQNFQMLAQAATAAAAANNNPPGVIGTPNDKEAFKKIAPQYSATMKLLGLIQKMSDHRAKYGVETPFTEGGALGNMMATGGQLIMKDSEKLGVLAGPDMDLLTSLIDDPGRVGHVQSGLKYLYQRAIDNLESDLTGYNLALDRSKIPALEVKDRGFGGTAADVATSVVKVIPGI